ncbi:dTDP-4-dehydrorhamnose reductase [Aerococcaceae bacterium zg-BR22]|uniref:dTDP-4-dehydrorhamnose reductase n=1 Tax=Aerococcaceae bacterium zg-1292 TaxID=2774330 RepID=UPI0040631C40|nr:dTDP-4-dehydrorhamnose reductase [Aerococcaceae bacterium zg-BR22]
MILITGANGQLGTELRYLLDEQKQEYLATDAQNLDITDEAVVMEYFGLHRPTVVYHCAAYTAVDMAEDEGKELCYRVNELGTQNIANAAKKYNALVVYISTDYVFDGMLRDSEYDEESPTNPQNVYGDSKLKGELVLKASGAKYYIIRTSWVFGQFGKNFVFTMQNLAQSRDTLTIVNDQFGRPTWTRTLAEFMVHVVRTNQPQGIYHLSNDNSCSWFEFAKEILKNHPTVTVEPVTSQQFVQKAKRPAHSIMSLEKAKATGFAIPTWQDALQRMLSEG